MKTDEIVKLWKEDAKINKNELDDEASKIAYLHGKYWKIYLDEKKVLKARKEKHKQLRKLKLEYFQGKLSKEELDENGWEQFPNIVLRQDLEIYMDADKDIIKSILMIANQEDKVDFLKDILKSLHNRGFHLKTAMDFLKYAAGLS